MEGIVGYAAFEILLLEILEKFDFLFLLLCNFCFFGEIAFRDV